VEGVGTEAGPGVILGFFYEAAMDWVAVDVAKLLDAFCLGKMLKS
jgi:hypothetical protein